MMIRVKCQAQELVEKKNWCEVRRYFLTLYFNLPKPSRREILSFCFGSPEVGNSVSKPTSLFTIPYISFSGNSVFSCFPLPHFLLLNHKPYWIWSDRIRIANMEKQEEGVCSAESVVDGSLDVWSCKNSDSSSADHLVVMVHGILGRLLLDSFS